MQREREGGLRGVFTAVLTPLDEHLDPDHEAFVRHCLRLLDAGCHGVSVFGTTGEGNSFSVAEREEALEALVEGGVPGERLLPGTGSCSLTDAVRLCEKAIEVGAGGVLVLPPFYYKDAGDEGLFRFFAELVERVGDERLRVYLYHIPQVSGVGLSLELMRRLHEAYPQTIVGTKDSEGRWERIERTCRELDGFEVFAGSEEFLLRTLRAGGVGCISASANLNSRLARRVYDLHEAGEDAEGAQRDLDALRKAMEGYPTIPALKALLHRATGEEGWTRLRPPLLPLGEREERELASGVPVEELL
ncbi:MAG: dihydrodipicolinate synthase family protein [Rubrobacteraceae bacterium]|uniref:dihydrodipicolinate synthase family protein n=1 Tax=Rubrobacter naiadicus TaxID=1392641 RepID=UPI00235F4308|nr:dihydrodipicolinate synthase family protein [Rubrobacter naiadicus]MCL6438609.1 dihydrodipicolinate synthase family protein [Rubrobacteraceae bacterium]